MKKKRTALQKHLSKLGRKGGNAKFEKVGSEGMRDMANNRWDKKRASKK